MNVDLKSIVFGAFLGGVFVAAVLSLVAPKSEVSRFENAGGSIVFDTQTGELWYLVGNSWFRKGNWDQRQH